MKTGGVSTHYLVLTFLAILVEMENGLKAELKIVCLISRAKMIENRIFVTTTKILVENCNFGQKWKILKIIMLTNKLLAIVKML